MMKKLLNKKLRMTIRERLSYILLTRHITDHYYVPNSDKPGTGTAYFKVDTKWYDFVQKLAGIKPETLILKRLGEEK